MPYWLADVCITDNMSRISKGVIQMLADFGGNKIPLLNPLVGRVVVERHHSTGKQVEILNKLLQVTSTIYISRK